MTGWVKPDGTTKRVPPDQLGVIRNGHHIKLGRALGESSPWDESFEREFDDADGNFPSVISWLSCLDRQFRPGPTLTDRFVPQPATEEQLRALTESVVSLAVRGPMNREASVALAEHLRGPIRAPERHVLVGFNMRRSQRLIADGIGANGKFAVVFSAGREFVYGDGFFHNVKAVVNPPQNPKILAPLTPTMSVIVSRPISRNVQPLLSTIVLTDEEVDRCNHSVQIYSREALYFRSEKPTLDDAFTCGKHLEYAHPDNPIDTLIRAIPGVPDRDTSLDKFLFQP